MNEKALKYLRSIGAQKRALPNTPNELLPFAYYINDSGYCIVVVPMCFSDKNTPEDYIVPVPARYVLDKGYRIENGFVYCDVPYDKILGAVIPEGFEDYDNNDTPAENYMALEVGKPFEPYVGQGEGIIFSIDKSGATLYVNFHNPTQHEIEQFGANKPLRVAAFVKEHLLFMLFKFGDLEWIDAPYSPYLGNTDILACVTGEKPLTLMCVLLDSPSAIIKQKIRMVALSPYFTKRLSDELRDMMAHQYSDSVYYEAVGNMTRRYSTRDMVKDAFASCSISI